VSQRVVDELHLVLAAIHSERGAPKPFESERRPNGSFVITMIPQGWREALSLKEKTLQVVTRPNCEAVATFDPTTLEGGVVAILGAGNFDAPIDILHTLFLANKVALFKPNPVNQFSADITQAIFKPLIDRGYLAYVYGAGRIGQQLVHQLGSGLSVRCPRLRFPISVSSFKKWF